MGDLQLSMACHLSDRNQALYDGRVSPEGIALNVLSLAPAEMFSRFLRHREFDVSELSMCRCMVSIDQGSDFTALPVFTLRAFRHGNIFVRPDAGIDEPEDLRNRTIGITGYQTTTLLWLKGILHHEYDVPVDQVHWVQSGLDDPEVGTEVDVNLPSSIDLEYSDESLLELLKRGAIDAIMSSKTPTALHTAAYLERLFPNYPEVEREYFERTGHFPILHSVVVRDEVLENHPWAAVELYKSFEEAKEIGMEKLRDVEESPVALPWLSSALEKTHDVMGHDYWPYGIDENEHTLRTMAQYAHEQGLTSKEFDISDLFVQQLQ